jgi:hypothetical protein
MSANGSLLPELDEAEDKVLDAITWVEDLLFDTQRPGWDPSIFTGAQALAAPLQEILEGLHRSQHEAILDKLLEGPHRSQH